MSKEQPDKEGRERQRRLQRRNGAVFLALASFAALVYAITIVKIKLGYGP